MAKKGIHPKTYKLIYKYNDDIQFEVESTNNVGVIHMGSVWPPQSHPAWNKQQSGSSMKSTTSSCKFAEKYGDDLFE